MLIPLIRRFAVHLVTGAASIGLALASHSIFDGDSGQLDYYLDDRVADLNNLLSSMLIPVFAGLLSWDVSKLQKSNVLNADAAKGRWRIIFRAATPTVVVAFAVFALLDLLYVGVPEASARGLFGLFLPYAALFAVLLFWSGIAIHTPVALSVPLSVLVTWFAVAYPPSLGWEWARHITGTLSGCCSVTEALSGAAILATLLVLTAISLLGFASMSRRPAIPLCVAGALGVGLLLLAGYLIQPLGWESVVPRDERELTCQRAEDSSICLWPEHIEMFPIVTAEAMHVRSLLSESGIVLPQELTEAVDTAKWEYDKFIDDSKIPDRESTHIWRVHLHPAIAQQPTLLREQLINNVIPQPVCRAHRIRADDPRRSSEKLAPVARAAVWQLIGHESGEWLGLDSDQRQTVSNLLATADFDASEFIDASVQAILQCDPVDIDNIDSLLTN